MSVLVAARKAENESSSMSPAAAKYGKADATVAQVTGSQESDQSILNKLQEQSKKHQEQIYMLIKLWKSEKSSNFRGVCRGGRSRGHRGLVHLVEQVMVFS